MQKSNFVVETLINTLKHHIVTKFMAFRLFLYLYLTSICTLKTVQYKAQGHSFLYLIDVINRELFVIHSHYS